MLNFGKYRTMGSYFKSGQKQNGFFPVLCKLWSKWQYLLG